MKITPEEVRHVAWLARLALSDEQVERLAGQLDAILTYVDKLNELDTSEVEPTAHVAQFAQPLRSDEPREVLDRSRALEAAPEHDEFAFIVPRVI